MDTAQLAPSRPPVPNRLRKAWEEIENKNSSIIEPVVFPSLPRGTWVPQLHFQYFKMGIIFPVAGTAGESLL